MFARAKLVDGKMKLTAIDRWNEEIESVLVSIDGRDRPDSAHIFYFLGKHNVVLTNMNFMDDKDLLALSRTIMRYGTIAKAFDGFLYTPNLEDMTRYLSSANGHVIAKLEEKYENK